MVLAFRPTHWGPWPGILQPEAANRSLAVLGMGDPSPDLHVPTPNHQISGRLEAPASGPALRAGSGNPRPAHRMLFDYRRAHWSQPGGGRAEYRLAVRI